MKTYLPAIGSLFTVTRNFVRVTSLAATLALGSSAAPARAAEGKFIAHEWGTFTSVQGADGVLLNWRPLESSQLPKFVHDWQHSGLVLAPASFIAFGKGEMVALQRMETPVIYFYSDTPRIASVDVAFPKGVVTEWYPEAALIGPAAPKAVVAKPASGTRASAAELALSLDCSGMGRRLEVTGVTESRISWPFVRILGAKNTSAHNPPTDPSGSHYFAARETDASLIEVPSISSTTRSFETENFLFYRGVANFATPLRVTMDPENRVTVANMGNEPLDHLFLLTVEQGTARVLPLERLEAGGLGSVQPEKGASASLAEATAQIKARMVQALEKEGLYHREALAMVETWKDSWFTEEGVRVLYILPRTWTDRTLPLTIQPPPTEVARVMVGRAEVLTPARVGTLAASLVKAGNGASDRAQAIADLRKLGRFAEPALRLATGKLDAGAKQNAWAIFQAARTAEAPTVAQKSP